MHMAALKAQHVKNILCLCFKCIIKLLMTHCDYATIPAETKIFIFGRSWTIIYFENAHRLTSMLRFSQQIIVQSRLKSENHASSKSSAGITGDYVSWLSNKSYSTQNRTTWNRCILLAWLRRLLRVILGINIFLSGWKIKREIGSGICWIARH